MKTTTTKNKLKTTALPSILSALSLMALVASTPVSAAKYGVKVIDESGQALEGVAVCIGMHGNYGQFGSMVTDASGIAMLEVPNTPFVLTVSKKHIGSVRVNEPARGFNLVKEVTLGQGFTSAACNVEASKNSESSIRISDIQVNDSAFATTLQPQVEGSPTEYRVSKTNTFAGAKWQRFDTTIPLSANLSEEDEVFVQMRRFMGDKKSWIEARSDVVNVKLPTFE